jgi:hypothetical protein
MLILGVKALGMISQAVSLLAELLFLVRIGDVLALIESRLAIAVVRSCIHIGCGFSPYRVIVSGFFAKRYRTSLRFRLFPLTFVKSSRIEKRASPTMLQITLSNRSINTMVRIRLTPPPP